MEKIVIFCSRIIGSSIFSAVVLLIAVSCTIKPNNSERIQLSDEEVDTIVVEEKVVPADAEDKETIDQGMVGDAYIQVLDEHLRANADRGFFKCEYFLYDITGNGTPELWIKSGTCEADYMLYIYTNDNDLKKIHEGYAGHSCFFAGKDYVIQMCAHMGFSTWYKITYNRSIRIVEVWNEKTNDDYKMPSEDYIEMTRVIW